MQAQWCLFDRSRPKRSNEEDIGLSSKRQRRVRSELESSEECEDSPQIRGGSSRPRPPELGRPPNRGTNTASRANQTTQNTAVTPRTAQRGIRIVDSDDEDDEDWRPQRTHPANTNQPATGAAVNTTTTTKGPAKGPAKAPTKPPAKGGIQRTTNPPNQPPKVGNTTAPVPPPQGPQQLPTPPNTGPSNRKQGAGTGAGTGTSGTRGTSSTTITTPHGPPPPFAQEAEIVALFSKLQEMVVMWVEECLPETFPPEFKTDKPERYWELCGWCKPLRLGDLMLSHRSGAKYVYESWVWRFLYQEILRPESVVWAGNDVPTDEGGAGGLGRTTNGHFDSLFDPSQTAMTEPQFRARIQNRANIMNMVRSGLVRPDRVHLITRWLVTEMLVAFHPYFSDTYKPIDKPQNIEVLIRDTRSLIVMARELDNKLRGARHVYDLILGREGDVCGISGVPWPAIQRYDATDQYYLQDPSTIGLIVVPGLMKFDIQESIYTADDAVNKSIVLHARAFTQRHLSAVVAR